MTPSFLIGVVDDDQDVRTSLADLLRAGGYRAACFGTAEEFLHSPDKDECACVFADIRNSMPSYAGSGEPCRIHDWRERSVHRPTHEHKAV